MKVLRLFGLLGLCIFSFQSCGAPNALMDKSLSYSFGLETPFFYDVKLVEKEVDDLGRHLYIFDVVVSFAADSSAEVGYTLNYSTLSFSGVCFSTEGVARGSNKHFRSQCLLPKPDDLFVQLSLTGPENSRLVKEFRF